MTLSRRHILVLSIYCNARGFAFVLFEGPLAPFDWAIHTLRGRQKHARCLQRITATLDRYLPDILVIQDTSASGTHRSPRVTSLNVEIASRAIRRQIPIYAYTRADVQHAFNEMGFANKHEMAQLIAKQI